MNDITVALARISKIFSKYNAEYPFDYAFVDEVYDKKFSTLKKTLLITGIFSSIAIFIACLGLVGLSLYMIESRSKEIGVRKILGGSVLGITKLLCVSSLKPILIGILVFSPIAWLAMEWWLQSYDYRINLNVVTILLAALTLLVIAFFTVFLQTVDAAKTNPVSKLKSE
jgi:putative ABC transport system permease protein